MSIEKLIRELNEFYDANDLVEYGMFVIEHNYSVEDAWNFLYNTTLAEYRHQETVYPIGCYEQWYEVLHDRNI